MDLQKKKLFSLLNNVIAYKILHNYLFYGKIFLYCIRFCKFQDGL